METGRLSFLSVGRVADAHGLKGELYIRLKAKTADWLSDIKELRLENQGVTKTFPILKARAHKDGLLIQVTGVADRTAAEGLRGWYMQIPEDALVAEAGETPYLKELLGFQVFDGESAIGTVSKFESNGVQDLIVLLQPSGKTSLIPLVEPFIVKIDFNSRELRMRLPEGLVEA